MGAFALLIAAPSFAQENTAKSSQTTEVKTVAVESKKVVVTAKPVQEQAVKKEELKATKVIRAQELKAVEPKRKEENN